MGHCVSEAKYLYEMFTLKGVLSFEVAAVHVGPCPLASHSPWTLPFKRALPTAFNSKDLEALRTASS